MESQDLITYVQQPAETALDAQRAPANWEPDLIWDESGWPVGRLGLCQPQVAGDAHR
jgi:hypothetical protein